MKWLDKGSVGFFPTNPDLADIAGDSDFDFDNFHVWDLLDRKIPDFQVLDLQISRFPGSQIFKFPDFQIPRFPDAAGGAGAGGRTLRSQLDPSPDAPRDQIRRKEPLLQPGLGGGVTRSGSMVTFDSVDIVVKNANIFVSSEKGAGFGNLVG